MKTAIVKSRNDITKQIEIEGTAELLVCMDKTELQSFWEVKLNGNTCCRWVDNESIKEGEA